MFFDLIIELTDAFMGKKKKKNKSVTYFPMGGSQNQSKSYPKRDWKSKKEHTKTLADQIFGGNGYFCVGDEVNTDV